MISEEQIAAIQMRLGEFALTAATIDLDGFLEVSDLMASPQALAAGIPPKAVTSAAEWVEFARLLKPFRDHARERFDAIREELGVDESEWASAEAGCPVCGERRIDELGINDDETVDCATCGSRYALPGSAPEVAE